jgi:hypothetical protein
MFEPLMKRGVLHRDPQVLDLATSWPEINRTRDDDHLEA